MKILRRIYSLAWNNPYTKAPSHRCLRVWRYKPTDEEILKAYPDYKLGCGYSLHLDFVTPPIKHLPPEVAKLKNERRKKTIKLKWVKKNLPLLADQIIKDENLDWRSEL
jgi:hypothetical protein